MGFCNFVCNWQWLPHFKLVSAIFDQIFIYSPNDSPSKTMKSVFYFIYKAYLHSQDSHFQCFEFFSRPFHTFQIQKDKWKWNNL